MPEAYVDVFYGEWRLKGGSRYWTGTETDLVLAKKAGQVKDSDRVVVHERTRAAGEMTMSVLSRLPGFLLCDGSQFDKEIYKDLYKALGTDHVPDMREAAPVGAGERSSGVTQHDEFYSGQFKDDQTQNHVHSRGTMEITGGVNNIQKERGEYSSGAYGAFNCNTWRGRSDSGSGHDAACNIGFRASRTWTGETSYPIGKSDSFQKVASPSGNPAAQGWYELKTVLQNTTDNTVISGKEYYDSSGNKIADPLAGVSPAALGWYEEVPEQPEKFVPTTDTYVKAFTIYYDASGNQVFGPVPADDMTIDPSTMGWYNRIPPVPARRVLSSDTSIDLNKLYYANLTSEDSVDVYAYVNPQAKGWKEAVSEEYVLTSDISVKAGKSYYRKIVSNDSVRAGNVTRGKRFGVNFFIAY